VDTVSTLSFANRAAQLRLACFHCGLEVDAAAKFHVFVDGAARDMCCAGCAAVAETIVASGLADFYRHRSAPSSKPEDLVPEELRNLERFDIDEVQNEFVRAFVHPDDGVVKEAQLLLEGITCPACLWLAEQRLKGIPGVLDATVNYASERATVRWNSASVTLSAVLRAVAEVGLRAHPFDAAHRDSLRNTQRKRRILELAVAGLGMMQVMMYAVPVYLSEPGDVAPVFENLMRWASLALTLPVVLFSARSFFSAAWRDLRCRRIGMDGPIAIAVAAAFAASAWATVFGRGEVYFDSVTMFVFLLLGARFIEAEARDRATAAIERQSRAPPATALQMLHYPISRTTRTVASATLAVDDVVLVESGAVIPSDGEIVEGVSEVDEALISGESLPIAKTRCDTVIGGSINVGSPLVVRVSRAGPDSVLAQIVHLAHRALSEKPHIAQVADRVASWFAATVLLLAGLTLFWWLTEPGNAWFRNAIAVLVVTCPCALALATPAALSAANGRLAQLGLLATRGHVVETYARITDMVFDKTGTLTRNEMRVACVNTLGPVDRHACLDLAAALEAGSSHPIAKALVEAAYRKTHGTTHGIVPSARHITHFAGQGIEAEVNGERVRVGGAGFVSALVGKPLLFDATAMPITGSRTHVLLGRQGDWLARIELDDPLRLDAKTALAALRSAGVRTHTVSGDLPEPVRAAAEELGVPEVHSQATPQQKLEYVAALQRAGRVVAMVGDGVNDAPVLAKADLSIAIGGGTELARGNADLVLLSPGLGALHDGLRVARAARRVIYQNIAWAVAYNAVFVPLAMAGRLSPWIAALGMSMSSLLVVANAARLMRRGRR
jgi:P-type Cu2+ transporter